MRKLLFLLFAICSLNVFSNGIQNIQLNMTDAKDKIPIYGDDINSGRPVLRSVELSPVIAYIENNILVVEFNYPVEGVTISIIDSSTGECIYWDFMENQGRVTIDVSDKVSAKYELNISTSNWNVSGTFEL